MSVCVRVSQWLILKIDLFKINLLYALFFLDQQS